MREAEEELGLRRQNLLSTFVGWSGSITGMDASYPMTIYAGKVKSADDFDTPGYETAKTVWLSCEQFKAEGRKSHLPIVDSIYRKVVQIEQIS